MRTTKDDKTTSEPEAEEHKHDTTREDESSSTLRPLLFRSLLASLLIHLSPLLLLLHFDLAFAPVELDTEWFGEFEKLEAIGHGDHFAPQQVQLAVKEDEKKEEAPQPPEEPEPEEPELEDPEPPEPEPKAPEPEEKEETEPQKKEAKEEKVEKEEKKEPPVAVARQEKTPPEPEKSTPESDEPEKTKAPPSTPSTAEALPGLEYDGPSNLPMLKNYAPGNARMTALIRLDTLRGTPYHEHTNALLQAVPDYRIILAESDTDAVRDFDAIFTASADPRYLQETFLVVKHSLGKKRMQQRLDDRFADPSPWTTYRGVATRDIVPASSPYQDPRKILLPSSDTALVARTEWLSELTNDQPADSSLRPSFEGEEPPKFTMLESLEHIANAAPEDTMLLASFQGLYFYLPGYGSLPKMEAVKLSITTPSKPLVTIDLQFATNAQAASFEAKCPTMKKKLIGAIPGARFMKIDDYVNRLECEASDTYVTVKGAYTQKEFLRAIQLATPFLPKPPDLADLPTPPERQPTPADMGQPIDVTSEDMGQPLEDATPDMPIAPRAPSNAPASSSPIEAKANDLGTSDDPTSPDKPEDSERSTQKAPSSPNAMPSQAEAPASERDMAPSLLPEQGD